MLIPMFCRLRVTGDIPDKVRDSAMVLVSNHIGPFDPFVLIAACARRGLYPRFLATAGLFRTPVFGSVMRGCGHIQVDRGTHTVTEALHRAIEALDEGSCVVVYPEGGITLDPGMWPQRGKTGAARLSLASKAPVHVVAQWGAHEVMAWDRPGLMVGTLVTALFRRPVARVHFGTTVSLDDLDAATPHAARRATDRIMDACVETLIPLRDNEPVLPRRIDPVRPLSTAHTHRRPGTP
ncbi:MAG TPA: lysophospholipid acyltransferase family protein [Stackebrandtia sp.]|nr:lysophospholipid acyltransferase family protein [Stackebrandtia sp.]HZE39415.1 lysophospholipid acyltransferase family protein [Stackebrandtia sp.]